MIKTSSFLTGLTLFLATSFLPATVFAADLHNGMISVASLDGTQDVTILGVTLEADHEGTALLGSVFLSDKTEIGAGYSKSELTLLGSEFDEEIMFANAKYHFSRANLREGHGMGLAAEIVISDTKLSYNSSSDYNQTTHVGLNYQLGLGAGFTLDTAIRTVIDDIGEGYIADIGIIKTLDDLVLKATYTLSTDEADISSSDGDTLMVSIGFLF